MQGFSILISKLKLFFMALLEISPKNTYRNVSDFTATQKNQLGRSRVGVIHVIPAKIVKSSRSVAAPQLTILYI